MSDFDDYSFWHGKLHGETAPRAYEPPGKSPYRKGQLIVDAFDTGDAKLFTKLVTGSCGHTIGDTHSPRGLAALLFNHANGIEIYRRFVAEGAAANEPLQMEVSLYTRALLDDRQDWIGALQKAANRKREHRQFHDEVKQHASYRDSYDDVFLRRWWRAGAPAAFIYNESIRRGHCDLMGAVAASGDLPAKSVDFHAVAENFHSYFGGGHGRALKVPQKDPNPLVAALKRDGQWDGSVMIGVEPAELLAQNDAGVLRETWDALGAVDRYEHYSLAFRSHILETAIMAEHPLLADLMKFPVVEEDMKDSMMAAMTVGRVDLLGPLEAIGAPMPLYDAGGWLNGLLRTQGHTRYLPTLSYLLANGASLDGFDIEDSRTEHLWNKDAADVLSWIALERPARKLEYVKHALDGKRCRPRTATAIWTQLHAAEKAALMPTIQVLHKKALRFGHLTMILWAREHAGITSPDIEALAAMPKHEAFQVHGRGPSRWHSVVRVAPPAGLEAKSPYGFKPAVFDAVSNWLRHGEGMRVEKERNQAAYSLSVLFGSVRQVGEYLSIWGNKESKKPLHDLSLFKLPTYGLWDIAAWRSKVMRFGPELARLARFAPAVGQPPETLNKMREMTAAFVYSRGKEHPDLAALCQQYDLDEKDFEVALRLAKRAYPKNAVHIPAVTIDGQDVGQPGYRMRRLEPGDIRGLFLGEMTACCQSVGGYGASCAVHGYTSEQGGFYVWESKGGEIVAQAWVWRGKNKELVFDSLESMRKLPGSFYEPFLKAAAAEMLKGDVTRVMVGTGGETPSLGMKLDIPAKMADRSTNYSDSSEQYMVAKKSKVPAPSAGKGGLPSVPHLDAGRLTAIAGAADARDIAARR